MLWLVFTLLAVIFSGFISLIHRFVLKRHDFMSYGFLFQVIAAFFYLPLILFSFTIPTISFAWYVLLAGIIMWAITSATIFKSFQHIEASLRAPLYQLRVVFLLIFSYFLLSEPMTISKIFGTVMIFIGAVLLTIERGKLFKKLSNIGVQLTIVSALLIAITSIVDKMAMGYWPPAMYGFFVYLVPGSILGGFTLKRIDKFVRLVKSVTPLIVIAALFDVLAYYFLLNAYSLTEVSKVYPIVQLSVLFAVIGGIILLKEKKDILPKLIGAIIMILGAILISGVM